MYQSFSHFGRSVARALPGLLGFVLVALAGCSPYRAVFKAAQGQQILVEPAVLAADGEQVPFSITARVPAKVANYEDKVIYKLEFNYVYNEQGEQPKTEYVGGIQFVIGDYTYEHTGGDWLVATRSLAFPFTPDKHPGKLVVRSFATLVGKDPRRFRKYGPLRQDLAPGILTTTRLVVQRPRLDFTPETYKPATDSGVLELPVYFWPGLITFNGQYGTNAAELATFITDNVKTTSVRIVGSHSPEPADLKHPQLALKRARSVEKHYKELLDLYGYQNSTESVRFSLGARRHDWTDLLNRVENSALPEKQIDEIFDIVNGPGTYEHKAAELAKLPCADYLQLYVYPMLRYALVTVKHAPRPPRPDYELYLLAQRIAQGEEEPDVLTEEELRYAASLTPLLEDKRRIYEGALKTGLSWPACHNLGLIYLRMAAQELSPRVQTILLKKAVTNLTYAAHRNPMKAELWYHLATAQQRLGNNLEALHAFDYAAKATGDPDLMRQLFADKAALELTTGQPDDALESMKYAEHTYQTVMNRGLAALLQGNYPEAAARYEEALTMNPDDNGKLATYCRAVTAARAKDDTALSLWLPRAVALDNTAIGRATQDLEFRDYVNTDLFRNALRKP